VKTIQYLTDPMYASLYWPGVIAGLAVAVMCAVLSVLVVLKRLAFIGQGISHAAFGGIGIAAALGLTAAVGKAAPLHGIPQFGIVLLFCLGAALLIGVISRRGGGGEAGTHADTAIGIVLVGSMALGAILIHAARSGLSWESFLFGSLMGAANFDAATAWMLALVTVLVLWIGRRGLLFWAFDEPGAQAFGVNTGACRFVLLCLLALATVASMKIAGVVLATAMLVLPGATALKLSVRLWPVFAISIATSLVGIVGGIVLSFEQDWPPGPCIVGVLCAMFGVAAVVGASKDRRAVPAAT
jgi:ABC-type Mn2+/Zn2+ transport system permease subunit